MMAKELRGKRIGDVQKFDNSKDPHPFASRAYYHVRAQMPNKDEVHLFFTKRELDIALRRAVRLHDRLPKVHWLRDLLD